MRNTNEKRKKLVRKKTKGEQGLKEFQDFLANPFFPESSVNSSVSGLCSSDLCVGLKLQLETLECERAGLIQKVGDLETLLNSEKSHSALLTRKVNHLGCEFSRLQKSVAGLKSVNARTETAVSKKLHPQSKNHQRCSFLHMLASEL